MLHEARRELNDSAEETDCPVSWNNSKYTSSVVANIYPSVEGSTNVLIRAQIVSKMVVFIAILLKRRCLQYMFVGGSICQNTTTDCTCATKCALALSQDQEVCLRGLCAFILVS